MSETNPNENALIRGKVSTAGNVPVSPKEKTSELKIYDASAHNRFAFELKEDGLIYDIAHIYGALDDDERYMQWQRDFKIEARDDENVSEDMLEASGRYFDDVMLSTEGIDFPEGAEWKTLLTPTEKFESLQQALAVAIKDAETRSSERLVRSGLKESVTYLTEAWFNGTVTVQKHVMRSHTRELQKKYDRINSRQWKQEQTRGLRRKPKVEFIPQDDRFGELYDEMQISAEGFANGIIPLRFKTKVIHEIFGSKALDQKK